MPRPLRHWLPGGIYHLTARGNNRQQIFFDTADYRQYLLELHQCREKHPYRLLAFALMPNHVHLVVEAVPEGSLSEAMQWLGASYTRYFNGRHLRVGHLYQGRFYSNLVDRDTYLLEVTRYVHLNAFRAHLVQRPLDYPWSSYRIYAGLERDPWGMVDRERVLSFFGASPFEREKEYRLFVDRLAEQEAALERWVRTLRRNRLIPPTRWLIPQEVSDTSAALRSV